MTRTLTVSLSLLAALGGLFAQSSAVPVGTNVTGSLVKVRTTNAMSLAQAAANRSRLTTPRSVTRSLFPSLAGKNLDALPVWTGLGRRLHPSRRATRARSADFAFDAATAAVDELAGFELQRQALVQVNGLPVITPSPRFGFDGVTHKQQREANNGNQFSTEPPNPSIGVSSSWVLQGVNNAIQVYTLAGAPQLPAVISTNELYGVIPAIDRNTGVNGVYPTDMRVIYDHSIDRFFVIQRAQDYDEFGNPIGSSKIYIAMTKTNNPTGDYDVYILDTTDGNTFGCPCVADYPMIAFDQHGLHISSNEYTISEQFVRAQIHSISKTSLLSGAVNPTTYWYTLPFTTGYEFSVHPAMTPPGASYFTANGGVQYFVASQSRLGNDSKMMIFALGNTSSLATANPNLTLTQFLANTLEYSIPSLNATQKEGPRPYGESLFIPGPLPNIDGGDTRLQAVSYAGGRLWVSLATGVLDNDGNEVVGGAFVIFSPTIRANTLNAAVLRQGYFGVRGQHLLRPAIAVNAQGRGAIAATLVGPSYFPSAVYLPIDLLTGPSSVRMSAEGAAPADGFTGYDGFFGAGNARWGDYSTPVIAGDGSFWMTVEYIPNLPRSPLANWGAYIARIVP